jgi:hypothetical protein
VTVYHGILHFFSETGTEGGHWAFQDREFMGIPNPAVVCVRCGQYRKSPDEPIRPVTFSVWEPEDKKREDGATVMRGYRSITTPPPPDANLGPSEFDRRFTKDRNDRAALCLKEGHPEWKPVHPEGSWSYEGLHVLKDGDHLRVFNPDNPAKVVWEGDIQLVTHPLFTEDAGGFWIHADQAGEDRKAWAKMFFEGYPAELTTKV